MTENKEYAEKIDVFANEMHNFADYIRENPDNETLSRIQDMYLTLLPIEVELLSGIKRRFPKLFDYMIKEEEA